MPVLGFGSFGSGGGGGVAGAALTVSGVTSLDDGLITTDGAGTLTVTGNITAANLPSSFFSGAYADLTGTPTLFSGSWNDLSDKPTIPDAQVNSDWNATSGVAQILNKPTLFSGAYSDLSGKPTLGTAAAQNTSAFDAAGAASSAQSYAIQRDNHTGTQSASTITGLATVATSGAYGDLFGRPSIPTTSDNLTEGLTNLYFTSARALSAVTWSTLTGKPTFATVATSGAYSDLTGRPSLATVATSGLASDLTGTLADARLSSNVALLSAANSFTAAQTIASGTLTASAPALNITQTWNNSGVVFTAATITATDTASATGSKLLELKVGATTVFQSAKSGIAYASSWVTSPSGFRVSSNTDSTSQSMQLNASLGLGSSGTINWGSTGVGGSALDLYIYRDAAQTLAQRNGTNAQTSRIYGTYTDASNGRRLDITSTTGGIFTLTATGNGTGASGNLLKLTQPILLPASSVTLATNGDLAFEATSNTTLTIRYRGSDGTTRSTALTLA